jgi:hypothetical protein
MYPACHHLNAPKTNVNDEHERSYPNQVGSMYRKLEQLDLFKLCGSSVTNDANFAGDVFIEDGETRRNRRRQRITIAAN